MNTTLVLAQAAGAEAAKDLGGDVVTGGITLGLLSVFLVITFVAIKAYKVKIGAVVLGSCVGVLGAGSPIVGDLTRALIDVIVTIITSVASSIG